MRQQPSREVHVIELAVSRRVTCAALLAVAAALFPASMSRAEGIPIAFYISPSDDGAGGETLVIAPDSGTVVLPIWADASQAGGGSGVFSMQDVLFRTSGDLAIVSFVCEAVECQVGTRPDPAREILLTAGDDASEAPSLVNTFKLGVVTLEVGEEPRDLRLEAGTAIDGEAAADNLEITDLPNEGILVVPKPSTSLLSLAAIAALAWRRKRSGPVSARQEAKP
jgi:hypothetical protein